ncbi:MAG TPA: hypothetical protein VG603_00735, partial [Chitinophagales bacterium]|nr:hypothetical protein [Chitinophagales bacterium]
MKRIIPILLLMLASCKRDFPAVPKDIIPPTEMKDILGDMMIADALSETRGLGGAAEKQYTE